MFEETTKHNVMLRLTIFVSFIFLLIETRVLINVIKVNNDDNNESMIYVIGVKINK